MKHLCVRVPNIVVWWRVYLKIKIKTIIFALKLVDGVLMFNFSVTLNIKIVVFWVLL
jgi:hypothetical protein